MHIGIRSLGLRGCLRCGLTVSGMEQLSLFRHNVTHRGTTFGQDKPCSKHNIRTQRIPKRGHMSKKWFAMSLCIAPQSAWTLSNNPNDIKLSNVLTMRAALAQVQRGLPPEESQNRHSSSSVVFVSCALCSNAKAVHITEIPFRS